LRAPFALWLLFSVAAYAVKCSFAAPSASWIPAGLALLSVIGTRAVT
jgi:hypothetical protein